jgi:hypothetical protein
MTFPFNRPEPARPSRSLRWRPTEEGRQEMDAHTRNTALNARFSYNPRVSPQARVLEEPEPGDLTRSAEWVIVHEGDQVVRLGDDQDSPLRVRRQATPAAAAAVFE